MRQFLEFDDTIGWAFSILCALQFSGLSPADFLPKRSIIFQASFRFRLLVLISVSFFVCFCVLSKGMMRSVFAVRKFVQYNQSNFLKAKRENLLN